MKFTQERTTANVVRSFEPGAIQVGEQTITGHVILSADAITAWSPANPPEISLDDLAPALGLEPEVLILGTGATIRFPSASLLGTLAGRGVGVEVMDTAAACRTYNVLVHEQRAVAAALLNEVNA